MIYNKEGDIMISLVQLLQYYFCEYSTIFVRNGE